MSRKGKPVVAPPWVFVLGPIPGTWLRCDLSIALTGCPYCHAKQWEPCEFESGPRGGSHFHRRKAAEKAAKVGPMPYCPWMQAMATFQAGSSSRSDKMVFGGPMMMKVKERWADDAC